MLVQRSSPRWQPVRDLCPLAATGLTLSKHRLCL